MMNCECSIMNVKSRRRNYSFLRIYSMIARTKLAIPETVTSVLAIALKLSYVCKRAIARPKKSAQNIISSLSMLGISFESRRNVRENLSDARSYQALCVSLCLDFCAGLKRSRIKNIRSSMSQRIKSIGSWI